MKRHTLLASVTDPDHGEHGSITRPHPDAELLAACAALDRLEQSYRDTGFNHPLGSPANRAADAERDRIEEAQGPLVTRIVDLRAVTHEGQVARARSLVLWAPDLIEEGTGDTIARLTHAVLRDLLAGSAAI